MSDTTTHTPATVAKGEKKEITVLLIKTKGTQTRVGLDKDTVDSYAEDMKAGAPFPPPVLYADGTTNGNGTIKYWVADGHHRVAAAKQIEWETMWCEVRYGGQRDALKCSLKANKAQGLRRTNADKKHAVGLVLADDEWRNLSSHQIADMCGVTHPFVLKEKQRLEPDLEPGVNREQVETVTTSNPPPTPRCEGKDGKSYPATKSQHQPAPNSEQPADDPAADEQDALMLKAGFSPAMIAAAKGQESKNGKPFVCSVLIQKTQRNLSELSRQLCKLGLFEKYNAALSAIISDVKEIAGLKQAPVKGASGPKPAPASGFQNPAPANRPQPKPQPQPGNQIDEKVPF